jgi:hypothetical protein
VLIYVYSPAYTYNDMHVYRAEATVLAEKSRVLRDAAEELYLHDKVKRHQSATEAEFERIQRDVEEEDLRVKEADRLKDLEEVTRARSSSKEMLTGPSDWVPMR